MNWSSSVLSSVSSDTEPSIIVTFDHAKYIFNTSENTTRSFLQSGRNWKRTRALFYSQARIEKTGGLPGLLMTFADATLDNLSLYGPQGLNHILASMRFYTSRDTMRLNSTEIPWITNPTPDPTPCYADDHVKVYAIPAFAPPDIPIPSETTPLQIIENDIITEEASGKRKRELSPDVPQKRPNIEKSATTKPYSSALQLEMDKEDFAPETLRGELADEYRSAVISSMFPFTNPNTDKAGKTPKIQNKNKNCKGATQGADPPAPEEKAEIDDDQRTRMPPGFPQPPGFRLQLPPPSTSLSQSKNPSAMSYIVVGPSYRGKFNAEKATELRVPKHMRSMLARGESITYDVQVGDETVQRTVKPDEVIAPPEKIGAIAILDVPSVAHIPSLITSFRSSEFYQKFWSEDATVFDNPERGLNLRVVYHTCGEGVLEDERYKAFMHGFGPLAHHIVGSREHCSDPVTFTSAAYNQLRLNALDDQIFRVPKYSLTPKKSLSEVSGLPQNVIAMHSHLKTVMRPWNPPTPDPEVIRRDKFHPLASGLTPLEISTTLKQSMQKARKNVAQIILDKGSELKGEPGADVGIITLGTGGSLPTKYRNVLSTLITIPKWGNILLDAGEGTWGQMARNFGQEDSEYNVWQALRDLKCIFISHMHADHHIGLANILAKRAILDPPPTEPLYVVSIRGVHLYLREISAIQDIGLNDPSGNGVVPVLSESLHYASRSEYSGQGIWEIGGNEPWLDFTTSAANGRQMCEALGLSSFQTVDVLHRCRCFGVVLRHEDGWSVTFSADTVPSAMLGRIGKNTTVLIHEATMADEEIELARRKNHSTIGQAIAEGKKMDAKYIMLSHFSARYPKMPRYLAEATPTATDFARENAIVPAFDHTNFVIGDMWKMQFYVPSVSRNFTDTFDDEEDADVVPIIGNVSRG